MSKYIDADKLIAEIDKRMDENCKLGEKAECFNHRAVEDNDILAIIDSLQQEQPEVDFEEEWDRFEDWVESYDQSDYPTCYEPKQIARHFYELGKNSK
jgi:hypothetical protein